jgi:dolichol kinase
MKKEFRRQFLHFVFGNITIILVIFFGIILFALLNLGILLIGLSLSLMVKNKRKTFIVKEIVSIVGRDYETKIPGQGALTFFLGTLLTSIIFWNHLIIVIGAITVLVYGDSFSTIIGKKLGKHFLQKNKTLEGSLGGIAAAFFTLTLLFPSDIAFFTALIGLSTEYFKVDDNVLMPLTSAIILWLLTVWI